MTTLSAPNQLTWKHAAAAATTSDLGGTFAPGTAPYQDTITGSGSALTVDGYTPVKGDHILVMNQSSGGNAILTLGNLVASAFTPTPAGEIATFSNLVGGSGYNTLPSSYPVSLTGGSGTGATATATCSGGAITSLTIINAGTGYAVGDVLGISGAGAGSGFSVHVASLVPVVAAANGNVTGVSLTGGTGSGAVATLAVTAGLVTAVTVTNPGSGYAVNDSLSATSSGVGSFTIAVQKVTGVAASQNGMYVVNTVGSTGSSGIGSIATLGSVTGGTGYTVGTYTGVELLGGTGTGALGTIVVGSGGTVSSVTVTTPGTGYTVGDVLSAPSAIIGYAGGHGFSVPVATVTTSPWVLERAFDYVDNSTIPGAACFVANGTTNGQHAFVQMACPVVLDTTALTFLKMF